MRKFIEENSKVLLTVAILLLLLKSCRDSRNLSDIKSDIKVIKETTFTKDEIGRELKISGLESEKRMIQSTDRKILDVRRQTEIDEEIKKLRGN